MVDYTEKDLWEQAAGEAGIVAAIVRGDADGTKVLVEAGDKLLLRYGGLLQVARVAVELLADALKIDEAAAAQRLAQAVVAKGS